MSDIKLIKLEVLVKFSIKLRAFDNDQEKLLLTNNTLNQMKLKTIKSPCFQLL